MPRLIACEVHVQDDPDPQRPRRVHKVLKIRATKEGMSLSDFLLREVIKVAEQPTTLEEMIERIRCREPVELDEDPAVTIRKLRGPLP